MSLETYAASPANSYTARASTRRSYTALELRRRNRDLVRSFLDKSGTEHGTVCMFVRNTFEYDARVMREIEALTDNGLAVIVIATAPSGDAIGVVEESRYTLIRVNHQATVVRILLDQMLSFERLYWRTSRYVWSFATLPFRSAGRLLAQRVAGNLVPNDDSRLPPKVRGFLATHTSRLASTLLKISMFRAERPPMGITLIKWIRTKVQAALWPAHRMLAAGYFVRLCVQMAQAIGDDTYHCHDQNTMLAGVLARRRNAARLIYDAHELYPHRNRPKPRRWKTFFFEIADRFFARRSDAVITVNQSIAEHLCRRYGLCNVDVVMNIPQVPTRSNGATAITSLDLRAIPRPRLFYCGNITFNRGLEEAVRALPHLPKGSLVIVGQARDNYVADLKSLAESLGVADRLYVFPPVPHEEVIGVAAQADVGLVMIKPNCLSYAYALPNKLFEYLHAGLPMVASDLPELRRIVDNEGVGLLCDHEDPISIAAAVQAITDSPMLAARVREQVVRTAQNYTWDREREKLLEVYRRLGVLDRCAEAEPPLAWGQIRRFPAPAAARRSVMPQRPNSAAEPSFADPRETVRQMSTTQLHELISTRLPAGSRVAVVSRGDDALLSLPGYEMGHFSQESSGLYAGYHPADTEAALRAVEQVSRLGYRYLAFPSTSLWWLSYYAGLRSTLELADPAIVDTDDCAIFDISCSSGRQPRGRDAHQLARAARRTLPPDGQWDVHQPQHG